MPLKSYTFCKWPGCNKLTREGYCEDHKEAGEKQRKERESKYKRSDYTKLEHTYKWQKYSKWFLRRPENQICKLHLQGCTLIATCVDHIIAPSGPDDPLFWEPSNHQAVCIHCNSVKGRKTIRGTFEL
jgi:5-methylcytosine-specific restriction protein A